ncbi:energy-coupling factor transporter transmembrane protein EcfT [Microbacterium esteraromaticum]|uniref:Energy-coupling factor transporter transmembrane protein EcfT n=1 Tax=Microbacterium esteraromaticum TaxID=57043 RepID=A0A7D7WD35_9MICO|nr:energy-coupling factor transporter transmembrane protein EcfT [Microbacterium esteraromaticum]QMU98315.1 energy-coupling factor transporter transmembrane protein EcfT [Microbacterium esteraromaticum]
MISLYRPGTSILHRLPAGAKLCALIVAALLVSFARPGSVGAVLLVLSASGLLLVAGLGWRGVAAAWWRLRWLILLLGGALWVFVDVGTAVQSTARVIALILLAESVTRSTRMGDLLDVLERAMRPLRRFGVDPASVALTVSLTIAMVPVLAGFLAQVRDAQRARGVRLGARAVLPLLVLTLRHADDVGDALAARGLAR